MREKNFNLKKEMASRLIRLARAAIKNAYAPYSRFRVGSAVLAGSGRIYTGANVENASYGLTICAERTAIFNAVQNGEKKILAVAIATEKEADKNPCGACLQVINEFAPSDALICLDRSRGSPVVRRLRDYLPLPFRFAKQ